ncbi:hypothetical protein HPB50_013392 [Hyalomma asiaticum]|uniref:Uncharacterized protein n=1 Tax=Hyalomma asiaticum TaxID=266040 RepID=A0ACB7RHW7_HYAAI|nr:hypothetical protein HPB50_013392 [Hyalomma asiaticum]
MKSPRLYEHLRAHKILVLPSRACLRRYIGGFKASFGFHGKLLELVKVKAQEMDEMKRHSGLVVDEMKLSAHLDMRSSGHIEGFVDLGKFTEDCVKHTKADHGLVVMFQPFIGKWTQVIAVFASCGNVKSRVLAKILLEATILCEQAGLHVDYICSDGASWNRSMWNAFGLRGTFKEVRCKVIHPSDPSRFLHFVSDFPHLIKCVRNAMIKTGFNTQNGRAHWEHVSTIWKVDSNSVTLKVAPKLTRTHIFPHGFAKMRVDLAFPVFSAAVVHAIDLHNEKNENIYPDVDPTRTFINLMANLIDAMTSRFPAEAQRQCKGSYQMMEFMDSWENHSKGLGFLSKNTSVGLIQTTKDLLRQAGGANDHPTPVQFVVIMRFISFCSLVRTPKGGNVSDDVLESLLSVEQLLPESNEQTEAGDNTNVSDAVEISVDHVSHIAERSDAHLVYYIAGYVVRKRILCINCGQCKAACLISKENVPPTLPADACLQWDLGGLI